VPHSVRRVVVLAALASLGVVAWAIVGGVAGLLYAAAAAIALAGLLLPPALKRRRGKIDDRDHPRASADEPVPSHGSSSGFARRLPGVRRLAFVGELEARLAEQQGENSALRERLETELGALRRADELLVRERIAHDETLVRAERSLELHCRERTLLENQLEAIEAIVTRSLPVLAPAVSAVGPETDLGPPNGGSAPTSERPKMAR
jgi:hypothetical protein